MRTGMSPHTVWLAVGLAFAKSAGHAYHEEMQQWRDAYESGLKQENGWLSLAGLFWLEEGENSFGSGSRNRIALPPGSAPESAGIFTFHAGETQVRPAPGVNLLLNGKPLPSAATLKPDSSGDPDRLSLGRLSMIVIHRGTRYAIRLWDNGSPARYSFTGVRWFPIKEAYRVTAQFTSYPQPKMIPVLNILGDTEQNPSPGYATFQLSGKTYRLEPVLEGDQLFFMFKDATSGHQTYPSGRFVYTALPSGGKVVIDFNQAHNPPCAFTPYATCPLPPKQNHLPIAIEAGELDHPHAAK